MQFHMRPSISRAGMSKCCAGKRSSVSTPRLYPSTLLRFVRCSLRPTLLWQNRPMVILVSCPQIRRRISPRSSRRYISQGSYPTHTPQSYFADHPLLLDPPNRIECRISRYFCRSSVWRQSTRCPLSAPSDLRSSVMRTRRLLRD